MLKKFYIKIVNAFNSIFNSFDNMMISRDLWLTQTNNIPNDSKALCVN